MKYLFTYIKSDKLYHIGLKKIHVPKRVMGKGKYFSVTSWRRLKEWMFTTIIIIYVTYHHGARSGCVSVHVEGL